MNKLELGVWYELGKATVHGYQSLAMFTPIGVILRTGTSKDSPILFIPGAKPSDFGIDKELESPPGAERDTIRSYGGTQGGGYR